MKRLFWVLPALTSLGAILISNAGIAAQRVILTYGPLRESVSVRDLTTLADTGTAPPDLQSHLSLARQNPEEVRQSLTKTVKVRAVVLDRVLNTSLGEALLDEVGQAIRPPSGAASRQALRSALVLSATGDDRLSVLEVLQNYPTAEVLLDGNRLVRTYKLIDDLANKIQNPLSIFR